MVTPCFKRSANSQEQTETSLGGIHLASHFEAKLNLIHGSLDYHCHPIDTVQVLDQDFRDFAVLQLKLQR